MSTENILSCFENIPFDPTHGLPDDVFYLVSRTTPLINVDLLIRDENGRVLLSWRDDKYAGNGWHLPGGIVRFKETFEARIEQVALNEIGIAVSHSPVPLAIHQMIHKTRDIRGHFISFLYNCFLSGDFRPDNKELLQEDAGYLAWHNSCPNDLLPVHEVYRQYIEEKLVDKFSVIMPHQVYF